MRELISSIRANTTLFRLYTAAVAVIFMTFIYSLLSFRDLPPIIPLFNQLPWGDARFSPAIGIFLPQIVVLGIYIFNAIFSSLILKSIPLISRMLAVTTLLISILTFLFTIRTIQLVI